MHFSDCTNHAVVARTTHNGPSKMMVGICKNNIIERFLLFVTLVGSVIFFQKPCSIRIFSKERFWHSFK